MAAEVGLAAFSSILSEVAKSFFAPIVRQTSYMFKYQSFVQDIKNQSKELGHKRQRVEEDVKQAERQGDKIYEDVQDWLKREEQFTGSVVKPIIEDESDSKKNCFKGVCPNLFKRYSLGRKAAKAKKEVDDLLGKGNFSKVSYRPAPETSLMPVRGYEQFDSRWSIFQDVIEALKDPNVNMIGVYGMGGVGKTMLVKQAARHVMENKLFEEVAMAEVTQTPDHKLIQDKIARDLGLQFEQHESVFERADRLREKLKTEKRVLVILDNIWRKLELDDIGIPYGEDRRRCTIILTSRKPDLLCNDMNSQKNFSIEILSKEEAGQLFEKIVGDSTKQSDFQPITEEIVGRCGGLPVAVITIANALKNKSLPIWKDALGQLRNSNPREIHGMGANVYSSIELSYNFLESDEAKSLFLLCSLFRQSESINVSYLLRYGMGRGLFKGVDTLEARWNRVHKLIYDLKASCLLLDGDAKDQVKLHDVIYDVAVSIAAEKLMYNISNTVDLKKEKVNIFQKDATAISLLHRDQELPERLECPKLELFLFFKETESYFRRRKKLVRYSSMQIPDLFFERMKELKVLHFTRICFPSLPSSFGCLINLQTLCLDGCQLENIAIIGKLKDLEILSFQDSDIEQLPVEIGQLTRLRLLDLSNCERLEVIAPNVISKLSRLEELYMSNSFTQWEKIEEGSNNASVADLKGLSKLTTLDICIKDAQVVQQDLGFEKLERYKILIGVAWSSYFNHGTSRLMKLRGLEENIFMGNEMKMSMKRTEDLHLEELKGFQNVVHELDDGEGFPRLKHFHVENCKEILHIVSSVGQVHGKVFPLLESLSLCKLINLEKVCHGQLAEDQSFINLTKVTVKGCHRLKYMFSYSMVNSLVRLQHLDIKECDSMEGVVDTTGLGQDDKKVVFTKLHYMQLSVLPKLTSFAIAMGIHYSEGNIHTGIQPQPFFDEKVRLPNLEILEITSNNLREIWHHQLASDSFNKLKDLSIKYCDRLINIFPAIVRLPNLEILKISDMKNLREIWHHQLASDSFNKLKDLSTRYCDGLINIFPPMVRLPNLEILKIRNMKNLREIWQTQLASDSFSKLKKLEISSCYALINIFPPMVQLPNIEILKINLKEIWHPQLASDSFSNLKDLEIYSCYSLINIFPPMVRLPNLEILKISNMKNLREIWQTQLASDSFSKLKKLEISSCYALINIFPTMVRLPNLETLKISYTKCLGEIWHPQLASDSFSNLKDLEIYSCFLLKNIFPLMVQHPNLERLKISYMENLREIWHPQLASDFFSKLKDLEIYFCDALINIFPPMARHSNLEVLSIRSAKHLGEIWHHQQDADSFSKLKDLSIISCDALINIFPPTVRFPNLKILKIYKTENLRAIWHPQLASDSFNKLKDLRIKYCDELINIFPPMVRLPNLELLKIIEVKNLREIWQTQLASDSFSKLKELEISSCYALINIFPPMVRLPNLEILTISDMKNLREIWHPQLASNSFSKLKDLSIGYCDALINIFLPMVRLPNLEILTISDMKNLREIWHPQLASNSFSKLKDLSIGYCDALINIFPPMVRLSNLKKLSIVYCNKLKNIFPSNMIMGRRFERLEELSVFGGKSIKEIIEETSSNCKDSMMEVGEVRKDHIVFSLLKSLSLEYLPSLQSFCLGNYTLKFPFLEIVVLRECPKMKTFSNGVLSTPKLHKVQVKEEDEEIDDDDEDEDENKGDGNEGRWEGNLNSTIQQFFKEMNAQSSTQE